MKIPTVKQLWEMYIKEDGEVGSSAMSASDTNAFKLGVQDLATSKPKKTKLMKRKLTFKVKK